MATSLAAQLKKLQAPQTSLLLQDKKRASLLFDPKEAANYDRQTIFELGVAGLEELKTLYARFSEFEATLFDLSSQSIERAVQSKEVNAKLNNNIRKFFFLLSPYFLLKPAHKALEWLIHRFHVHQYNADDLFMLALPYHESRIFIRVIQLIDVSSPSHPWHWLEPLQKKGVPLSKTALLNHAASSPSFLRQLCDTLLGAIKEHGHYAGVLSTLLAFYSSTVLGVLDRSRRGASETQIVPLLDALIRGLGSPVLDFTAASYIVLGRLVTTTSLSEQILKSLLIRLSKVHHLELESEKAMLFVLIYQTQKQNLKEVPFKTLSRLASTKSTAATFGLLASRGYDVVPFLECVMRGAIGIIQTQHAGSTLDMRSLVENVLKEVHFSASGAETIVKMFIEVFDVSALEDNEETALIAVGENNTPEEVISWYSTVLKQLERSYPTVFDKAVCRALKGLGVSPSQAATLRQMLGFNVQLDLFDKLHHQKNKIRAEALLCLARQSNQLKEKDEITMRESLLDILSDDSAVVVLAALAFPVEVLQRVLTRPAFHAKLVGILTKHVLDEGSNSKWVNVIPRAIDALTEIDQGSALEELESLLVLLPHIMLNPKYLKPVLESPFGSRNNFLKILHSSCKKSSNFSEALRNVILTKPGAIALNSVLELGEKLLLCQNVKECVEAKFTLLLLLAMSLPKNSSVENSLQVLSMSSQIMDGQEVSACSKHMNGSVLSLTSCLSSCKKGVVPLESYLLVVQTIMHQTKLNSLMPDGSWLSLEKQSPTTKLLVKIYVLLSDGCVTTDNDNQSAFVAGLKSYFETYFPTPRRQVEFLANFWVIHRVETGPDDVELSIDNQVRSLRLGGLLLSKCKDEKWSTSTAIDNIVFPALLLALSCPASPVRKAALEVLNRLPKHKPGRDTYNLLIGKIKGSVQELNLDSEQLQLILYSCLSPDPVVRSMLSTGESVVAPHILNALLDVVLNQQTPQYVSAALLSVLTSVNSEDILKKLFPLLGNILEGCKGLSAMDLHSSIILSNILSRLDSQTAGIFAAHSVWPIMTELLSNHSTLVVLNDHKTLCPAELACSQVTRELWEAIPEPQADFQQQLLSLMISAGTETENPLLLSAVSKSFKQLSIDASLLVVELSKMKDVSMQPSNPVQARRRTSSALPSPQILDTKEWRCGMTLLELLQNKKKLSNAHLLLPVLFGILKKCLYFEEQAPVEYAKQLLLSCILHCCQKLSPDGTPIPTSLVPTHVLEVEAIVHCVRDTQNPQTHHHALLLLAHMAALVPEQVLLNIMAIFTFMGSVVLRQDDAYSFQVITKIVNTIIPILIKVNDTGSLSAKARSELSVTITSVLSVFVDALLDIPEHRRLSLFHKLLTTLDPQQYLWLFLCLVMESHTVHHSETTNDSKKTRGASADSEAPKRIEVALQIVTQFSPSVILSNCVRLLRYLFILPIDKDDRRTLQVNSSTVGNLEEFRVKALFNVDNHTPKQLRHYKYTIVTFLSALLSSLPFVNKITTMNNDETNVLVPIYMEMLEVLLALIQGFSRQADSSGGTPTAKYWKVMVAQAYDILDKVNALLPSRLFLDIVKGLMVHELPSLRRKAMELLNSRLSTSQREAFLASCDSKDLLALLEPLMAIIGTINEGQLEELNEEMFLNQQTAMLSIKFLAKHLAYDNYGKFKPILEHMTSLISEVQIKNTNLLASIVLCAAELCSSLRAHAIASLPVLMPAFIKLISAQITEATDVVQISLAASLYRIVDSLASFISPYLHPLLVEVCSLSASHFHDEDEHSRSAHVALKLKNTRQKIANTIPTRVLVPAVGNAYEDLVERKQFEGIGPLMSVLAESFAGLIGADLTAMQSTLTDFFLNALQFRSTQGKNVPDEKVDEVENHVIKALVSFVLKLSETSFRPLYYKFFEWATRLNDHKERVITFYRLSYGVAECLKGLYVSFAGHFLKNAAALLDQCNLSKIGGRDDNEDNAVYSESNDPKLENLFFGSGPDSEKKCAALVNNILKTLHYVFLYDSQNFLSKERFETLMQPIVDQLENNLGGEDGLRQLASEVLVPCISQLAVACTDDTLWKQLNYQILLKTRHSNPMVRLVSLEAVCGVARKLGESFLPLLPETVPFLAELLEDEEETIETACRRSVQDLEQVLGEPIQKYF